jgi:hypothetical protein
VLKSSKKYLENLANFAVLLKRAKMSTNGVENALGVAELSKDFVETFFEDEIDKNRKRMEDEE